MPPTRNSTAKATATRVALYSRVSTSDQNVETQLGELRALATAKGWVVTREYQDVGISGVKASRPGLEAALRDAEAKNYDTLVTWKIDRIGRSLQNLLQVLERLTTCGVAFESLHDPGLSTTTASGNLMIGIIGSFAAYERTLLIERTRAGVARAQAEGKHCGRPRISLDLRAARKLLEAGESVRAVAAMLGIPRGTLRRRLAESEFEVDHKSPSATTAPGA